MQNQFSLKYQQKPSHFAQIRRNTTLLARPSLYNSNQVNGDNTANNNNGNSNNMRRQANCDPLRDEEDVICRPQSPEPIRSVNCQDGRDGERGPRGFQGVMGESIEGRPGRNGADGQQGLRGFQGFKGTEGAEGTPGRDGRDGENGPRGFQGPAGPKGETKIVPCSNCGNTDATTAAAPQQQQMMQPGPYYGQAPQGNPYYGAYAAAHRPIFAGPAAVPIPVAQPALAYAQQPSAALITTTTTSNNNNNNFCPGACNPCNAIGDGTLSTGINAFASFTFSVINNIPVNLNIGDAVRWQPQIPSRIIMLSSNAEDIIIGTADGGCRQDGIFEIIFTVVPQNPSQYGIQIQANSNRTSNRPDLNFGSGGVGGTFIPIVGTAIVRLTPGSIIRLVLLNTQNGGPSIFTSTQGGDGTSLVVSASITIKHIAYALTC